ncbi:MAG: hypothetical protein GY852_11150, partial [bacterium]|nr:hypothetical protein [bacterium]
NHYDNIKAGKLSSSIGADCVFPTMHDPSQAPPDRHTGAMYEMAPYALDGGEEMWWNGSLREEHEENFLKTLQKYAPNMTRDTVLWTYLSTPLDFSTKFLNMVKGSFKQGKYELFQMNTNRPNDECSNNRTPIKNLYTCGASNHPGGMVLFGPSYLAVNAIQEDYDIEKWWEEPDHVKAAKAKGYFDF